MKRFIGIDVGGTRLKAGLVGPNSDVSNEHVIMLSDSDKTEDGIIAKITEITRAVAGENRFDGIGLGVPGLVDVKRGMVVQSPNFPKWRNFAIRQTLEQCIDNPVYLDNDANCVLTGEFLNGVAVGHPTFIGLTLGTGVGGAIVLDGKVWRGVSGMAGELGHINVEPNGPACGCGSNGCLEQYASVVGLRQLCLTQPIEGVDPHSNNLPRVLFEAASAGNSRAQQHFSTAGTMLGRALAGLLNALNIDTVVLAGGVSAAFEWMEPTCREELLRRAYSLGGKVKLLVGTQGEKAGILGAAMQWQMEAEQ